MRTKATKRSRISAPPKSQPNPGGLGFRVVGIILGTLFTACLVTTVVVAGSLIFRTATVNVYDGYTVDPRLPVDVSIARGTSENVTYTLTNNEDDAYLFAPYVSTSLPVGMTVDIIPASATLEHGASQVFTFQINASESVTEEINTVVLAFPRAEVK